MQKSNIQMLKPKDNDLSVCCLKCFDHSNLFWI